MAPAFHPPRAADATRTGMRVAACALALAVPLAAAATLPPAQSVAAQPALRASAHAVVAQAAAPKPARSAPPSTAQGSDAQQLATLANPFPSSARAYLVQVGDADRWGMGVATPLPVASLAKMMTALLVDEALQRGDADVVVSRAAAAARGARLGLREDERMRASALLAAMLIASANDACRALAEWQDGSERAFVARMNARAAQWGLAGTHFVNACGFDAPAQHSTVRDLLALARRVLAQPALAALVARESMSVATANDRRFTLHATNALLGRVPGVIGVKTGFTNAAGRCLVVVAERDGRRVYAALLGAGDRWWDAAAMLERAFDAPRADSEPAR